MTDTGNVTKFLKKKNKVFVDQLEHVNDNFLPVSCTPLSSKNLSNLTCIV